MNDTPEFEPDTEPESDPVAEGGEIENQAPSVIVGYVRFRPGGRVYKYDAGSLPLRADDRVLVRSDRGNRLGTLTANPLAVDARHIRGALPRILRRADPRDIAREEANLRRGVEAQRICTHRIRERGLPMKLIRTETSHDGSRVTFSFYAEDRIDFRDLVRDLTQSLHARVDMKQIGPRDETKAVGGLGPCGRELCCTSWMQDFDAVSVKMAKAQGLSLNPSKLAGMCGRLKCCLRYEYDTYVQLGRDLPNVGTKVESVKGNGVVTKVNVLRQTVVVRRASDGVDTEVTLEDLVRKKESSQRSGPAPK